LKALIQRVQQASVKVEHQIVGEINQGIAILLGIGNADTEKDIDYIVNKILSIRIFPDQHSHFDQSVTEIKGEILVVSQFTLHADIKKGRRPSFSDAAKSDTAKNLFNKTILLLKKSDLKIETGTFGADMLVEIHNDGPVTLMIDSKTN
jgi:D-tyrosyl-tRNA(Tyr) deacylase|tara:strand:+ start:87 stop:533 length:447 start_codon:yes stop_codon:yes gene_type:complete